MKVLDTINDRKAKYDFLVKGIVVQVLRGNVISLKNAT
jgi:hypothetical protein